MPTQEANAPPWPPCENLFARPCSPPLCVRRPPRIPMSGFAPPEESVFPAMAPSIESSNPISFVVLLVCWVWEVKIAFQKGIVYGRWVLLSLGCSPVALFDCVSFAHVLALLGLAVKTRAFLVINVSRGVDPHQPMSTARCWSGGSRSRGGRCCGRRRAN